MNRNEAISGLVNYALEKEMIQPEEKAWAVNGLLDILQLDAFSWEAFSPPLHPVNASTAISVARPAETAFFTIAIMPFYVHSLRTIKK